MDIFSSVVIFSFGIQTPTALSDTAVVVFLHVIQAKSKLQGKKYGKKMCDYQPNYAGKEIEERFNML